MVSDVLGVKEPSDDFLETSIDHLEVSGDHELTFCLKDGSQVIRVWKDERNNSGYKRWRKHGTD